MPGSNWKLVVLFGFYTSFAGPVFAQTNSDNSQTSKWTHHFQFTVIAQKHSGFKSLYTGENSLADSVEPTAISLTSTLFLGRRLWRSGALYFNPEISGGKGLSFTTGVAGALNGETYRVGATEPQVFIARAYVQQHFALGETDYEYLPDKNNQIAGKVPASRITLTAGKFAMSDFFDDNSYSKDPRTQFFNWSIWANGAWDYPANTRGYTYGVVAELIKPSWSIRIATVAVPRIANYHLMQYNIPKAHSETLEFEHNVYINRKPGKVRLIMSNTKSKAPSYEQGMQAIATSDSLILNVISGNAENPSYGGKKFGLGLNLEQQLNNELGIFARVGWNDGKYASWAFTEIDQTVCIGLSSTGARWHRADDMAAIAFVGNGISKGHRQFLGAGGYGFIIGDGKLNYVNEAIIEAFYSANLFRYCWFTFDYQFVDNPGYNKDRGPVHVFGLRLHVEI